MIKISVIIPCYNVESYIKEAVCSVLEQRQVPWEIICVDDGSTDNTVAIIKELQSKYPGRIQLFINDKNKGATYTRNRGLAVASGDYIQFLDADDLLFPDKLELQTRKITESKSSPDILVGSCKKILIDKSDKELIFKERDPWCALVDSKLGVTSANLFKREKLLEVKGWADGLQSSQEYELMFRMLQKNATVLFSDTILNINREREFGSISKTNQGEKWQRYIGLRLKIYNYLCEEKLITSERKQTCINIIFDAIRFLYAFDPETAVEYHQQYVKTLGKPCATSSTSETYLKFYNLLGFKGAQLISRVFKKEPSFS